MIERFSNLCALSFTDCLTECFLGRSLSYMAGINNQTPSQPLLVSSRLPFQQDAVACLAKKGCLDCQQKQILESKSIHLLTLTSAGTA